MRFYDTHVHLSHDDYQADLPGLLQRAQAAGFAGLVAPGLNLQSSYQVVELAQRYPAIIPAVGLHPLSPAEDLESFRVLAHNPMVKAIGEIGLDSKGGPIKDQEQRFRFFLEVALEVDKPALIHVRNTWDDALRILADYPLPDKFVVHCFTGGVSEAAHIQELGGLLSVTAIVARKGMEKTLEVLKEWPLERMMLETDGPWLSWPGQSGPNEPTTVVRVAQLLADLKGVSLVEVAEKTTQATERFFRLESN